MAFLYMSYALREQDSAKGLDVLIDAITTRLAKEKEHLAADYEYVGEDAGDASTGYVWEQKGRNVTQVSLVDAYHDRVRYVTIGALDAAGCSRIHDALAKEFSFYTVEELIEKARACTETDAKWITMMGGATNHLFFPEAQKVIEAHLKSNSRALRQQAVEAAAAAHWPTLLPALKNAWQAEVDGGIRGVLEFVIAVCEQEAASGST